MICFKDLEMHPTTPVSLYSRATRAFQPFEAANQPLELAASLSLADRFKFDFIDFAVERMSSLFESQLALQLAGSIWGFYDCE